MPRLWTSHPYRGLRKATGQQVVVFAAGAAFPGTSSLRRTLPGVCEGDVCELSRSAGFGELYPCLV